MIYTKDNPKLVEYIYDFDEIETFTGVVEDKHNNVAYYLNGKIHRTDGPAVEQSNGDKEWYLNSYIHREDGPAVERSNGTKEWYLNGQFHREDGPAKEWADGTKYWYLNGKFYGTNDDFTNESWIRLVKLQLLK